MKQTEQLVWIIYDISENRPRTRVAKKCKDAGLYRVQKAVFLGTIERNRLDELTMGIQDQIDEESDKVYIFPMCEQDFHKVILQGQAFDKKLVTDEIMALIT